MRNLLTVAVSVCQVNAYNTEVAAIYLCMALIETHDPKMYLTKILDIC